MIKGDILILDIDGVVADMTEHEHLLATPNLTRSERWEAFWGQYSSAAPIEAGLELARSAADNGLEVRWSTTRPQATRSATTQWLRTHALPNPKKVLYRTDQQYRWTAQRCKIVHARHIAKNYPDRKVSFVDDDAKAVSELAGAGINAYLFPSQIPDTTRARIPISV